jgi:hypothetical protein
MDATSTATISASMLGAAVVTAVEVDGGVELFEQK